jgi:hypothetical protein
MGEYVGLHDNGKSSVQGFLDIFTGLFTAGVDLKNNTNSWKVSQRGAGANMSVDIAAGRGFLADTLINYPAWSDATVNVSVTASSPSNPRRDIVVAYIDESVPTTAVTNNSGALKFKVVAGVAAASPVDPSDPDIQTSVGAGNPWLKLARISVAASATTVVDANITGLRTNITLKALVTNSDLDTDSVTTSKILDGTITTAKYGDASVTDAKLQARFAEIISDYIYSGGVVAQVSGLDGSFSNIVYYVAGIRYSVTSVANKTYLASKDTYVDIGIDGTVDYNDVANGAAAPALAANHLRVAKVVTNGSAITSVSQSGADSLNNQIYPNNHNGFGSSKTWTLSPTGFSGSPTSSGSNYSQYGKWVFGYIDISGTSNTTGMGFTLPVAPRNTVRMTGFSTSDNGAALTTPGRIDLTAGSTTAVAYKDAAPNTWTAASTKAIRGHFMYEAA